MKKQDSMPAKGYALIHEELVALLLRLTRSNPRPALAIPGLTLVRYDKPTEPRGVVYPTSICLAIQGEKRVITGNKTLTYDANRFLISSIDVPVIAHVTDASKEKPYLGVVIGLNLKMIFDLIIEMNQVPAAASAHKSGMVISPISADILSAVFRLISLAENPSAAPILGPMIYREILYRVLTSEQGSWLKQVASAGSRNLQISKAIDWIRKNYAEPLKIEALSQLVGMGITNFHRHFKNITSMSPLQYQKWMRLHEALTKLFSKKMDAASVAFEVGYDSPSQFSREYSRMFGRPPLQDAKAMLAETD